MKAFVIKAKSMNQKIKIKINSAKSGGFARFIVEICQKEFLYLLTIGWNYAAKDNLNISK